MKKIVFLDIWVLALTIGAAVVWLGQIRHLGPIGVFLEPSILSLAILLGGVLVLVTPLLVMVKRSRSDLRGAKKRLLEPRPLSVWEDLQQHFGRKELFPEQKD